jgi:transcriptional regulator with PAS, ATPase and Fis domain
MTEPLKISDRIALSLHRMPKEKNKSWLAAQLGISRPTLYDRMQANSWTQEEITKMKQLGLI